MWKRMLILMFCFVLTACSAADKSSESTEQDNTETSVQDSAEQEIKEYIEFTDALGRDVKVKINPERVAVLLGSFTDVWMLAGGTVCASVDDAWNDLELDMGDAVNLGSIKSPDLESLFAVEPDFVIASAATASNVEWQQTLEDAGITVAYFEVGGFQDYLDMLNICTDITGRKDLYEKNGTDIQKKIEELKAGYEVKDTTVLFLRVSAGFIRAKNSEGSVMGEMLADLGCDNIADDDQSLLENLSIESILKRDPDHIFIVPFGDDFEGAMENLNTMVEENPAWKQLSAVQEDRVHYMDKRLFNMKPNARWAEAYEQLINILQE